MNYDMRLRVEDYILNSKWWERLEDSGEPMPQVKHMSDEVLFQMLISIVEAKQ